MKVVYHTRPCFFDYALCLVNELSKRVELHLIIEVSPDGWNGSVFDVPKLNCNTGMYEGFGIFKKYCSPHVLKYLSGCASITLAINNCPKSFSLKGMRFSLMMHRYIRRMRAGIIHYDEVSECCSFFMYLQNCSTTLLNIHDPLPHSGEGGWRRKASRYLSFRCCDRYVLFSKGLVHLFCSEYRVDENLIHLSKLGSYDIYKEMIELKDDVSNSYFLFFGRLSPYKGVDILCDAILILIKKHPKIKFVIAGKPVPTYNVPDLLFTNALADNVTYIEHYISNEDLAMLFSNAIAVVCPYLDATQSGVISTSYAFGKPIVATRTGGIPEYVKENQTGLLVRPGDYLDLASKLEALYLDPDLLESLERGVRSAISNELSWGIISDGLKKTYKLAVSGFEVK